MKPIKLLTLLMSLTASVAAFAACQFGKESTGGTSSPTESFSSAAESSSVAEESSSHTHGYTIAKKDDTHHWTECECGAATEKVAHSYTIAKNDETHHWKECSCGHKDESTQEAHVYAWKHDDTKHWKACECGAVEAGSEVAHDYKPQQDETHHWTECECGAATEKVAHAAAEGAEWKTDDTHHWKACECGAIVEKAEHAPDATKDPVITAETHAGTCVCGKPINATPHSYTVEKHDDTHHWKECSCGYKDESTQEAHVYAWKHDDTKHWKACECGAVEAGSEVEHDYKPQQNETHHWTECECGAKTDIIEHSYDWKHDDTHHWKECSCGKLDESSKAAHDYTIAKKDDTHHWTECECGAVTEKVAHAATADAEWKTDGEYHWKACPCGAEVEKAAHTGGEPSYNAERNVFIVACTECGKELSATDAVTIAFANCEQAAIRLEKDSVAMVSDPERTGYTFGGWHTAETWGKYGEESTVDLTVAIDEDITLYATWLKDDEDYVQTLHETAALISLFDADASDVSDYFDYPVIWNKLQKNLTEYEKENISFEDVSDALLAIRTACGDMQTTVVEFKVMDEDNDTEAYRAGLVRGYYRYGDAWKHAWDKDGMNMQYNTDGEGNFVEEFPIKANIQRAYILDGENVSFVKDSTEGSTKISEYKFVLRATNFKDICENYGYAVWNIRVNRAVSIDVYGKTYTVAANNVLPLSIDKDGKLYVKDECVTTLSENVFNGVDNGTEEEPEGLTVLVTKTTDEQYAHVEFSNVLCAYQLPVFEKVIVADTRKTVASTIDYSASGLNTQYKMYDTAVYAKGGALNGTHTFTLPNLKIGERGYILFGLTVREGDRGVTYKLSHTGEGAETITLFTTNTGKEECMIRVNADGSVLVNGEKIEFTMPQSVVSGEENIVMIMEITSAFWTNVHMLSCIYGANAERILKDRTHTLAGDALEVTGTNGEECYGTWENNTEIFEDGLKINVQAYKISEQKVKAENFVFTMKTLVYSGYETTISVAMNQGGKLTFGAQEITLDSKQIVKLTVKADGSVYANDVAVGYTLEEDVLNGQKAWSFGIFNDTLADDGTSNGKAQFGAFYISKTVTQTVAANE